MLISVSVNYNEIMSHLNTPVRSEVATSITGPPTPVSELAGLYGMSMLSSARNCPALFPRGCTVLHSHQQGMRFAVAPCPHQL